MKQGENYVIFDFVSSGTTQSYLQKVLPYRLTGYYFSRYTVPGRENCQIECYFDKSKLKMMDSYIEVEEYLTSPEPSLDRLNREGKALFAKEVRSEQELQELRLVLDTAEQFGKEFFSRFYWGDEYISSALLDEIYGAEGCHWVQHSAYDDWLRVEIKRRENSNDS